MNLAAFNGIPLSPFPGITYTFCCRCLHLISYTEERKKWPRVFKKNKQNKTKITGHLILKVQNNLSCRFGCKRKKVGAAQTMSAINVIFDVTKIKQVKCDIWCNKNKASKIWSVKELNNSFKWNTLNLNINLTLWDESALWKHQL